MRAGNCKNLTDPKFPKLQQTLSDFHLLPSPARLHAPTFLDILYGHCPQEPKGLRPAISRVPARPCPSPSPSFIPIRH
jgi:hypothetical protein